MKEAYIGVDIGSSGCKAIAVDGEGKTLGVQSVRYDNTLVCTGLGCYEQPARVLRDAGLDCIRALVRELGPDRPHGGHRPHRADARACGAGRTSGTAPPHPQLRRFPQ